MDTKEKKKKKHFSNIHSTNFYDELTLVFLYAPLLENRH